LPDDCAFCAIASGEADAHVVFEDSDTLAFLDNRPLFPGHSLLIPREHLETIWDLPDELLATLFENARLLSHAVRDATESQGAFIASNNIVSQSVPHFHVHLVPRNRKDGLRGFFWPRGKYRDEAQARETASAVRAAVGRAS
jgi:histidine triad (HIT) family protein